MKLKTVKPKTMKPKTVKPKTVKLRNIEVFMIFCCIIASGLCYAESNWAAPCFVVSSSAGLLDSIKHKALVGAIINGIFLTLNIALFVKGL